VREDLFEPAAWNQLMEAGAIGRLDLLRGEIDEAFIGTDAEGRETAPPGTEDEIFIDLHAAYLNAPTIGRNLIGDAAYEHLMERLDEGEHAIMLMSYGLYSFKGSGFVRGGIFDRIQLLQGDRAIQFRDSDLVRAPDIIADGAPRFTERDIFIIRDDIAFDPGEPWELGLLVRRAAGPLETEFVR
ncbi:MAG: regulatory protein NosR, partial [Wenzhouxiangella sp.]